MVIRVFNGVAISCCLHALGERDRDEKKVVGGGQEERCCVLCSPMFMSMKEEAMKVVHSSRMKEVL